MWYWKRLAIPTWDTETIKAWKSKGLSTESLKPPTTPGQSLAVRPKWIHNLKIAVKLKGSCLKQYKATFTHRNLLSLFIVSELDTCSRDLNLNLWWRSNKWIEWYCNSSKWKNFLYGRGVKSLSVKIKLY